MAAILVVDDDKVLLKVIEATLTRAGHQVTVVTDGYAAFEELGRAAFDLLISDVNMPGVSGFSLATTVRKDPKFQRMPILFVTGRKEKSDVMRAVKSGADAYIVKPLVTDDLTAKVASLLNATRSQPAKDIAVSFAATVSVELQISHVSERGITMTCTLPFPAGFVLNIGGPAFEKIGIAPPELRITTCQLADDDKAIYVIRANFVALAEGDLAKLRAWLDSSTAGGDASAA